MASIRLIASEANLRPKITVGAVIRPKEAATRFGKPLDQGTHDYREVLEWVIQEEDVDQFRVGLEDTPVLYGAHRSNAELVAMARNVCEEYGVRVINDIATARRIMGLDTPIQTTAKAA